MSPYARRTDATQRAIIQALEQCGWTVQDTSRLGGFVDAVAVKGWGSDYLKAKWQAVYEGNRTPPEPIVRLLEFKTGKGKLTKAQQAFHARFPVVILRTVDDALKLR